MAKKPVVKKVEDDPRYHDTWRLLKKYRDVVWSLELSVQQLKKQFEVEYGSSMLSLLNHSVDLLRTRHKNGEEFYWILYFTYLSPQQLKNAEEIIEQLRPHMQDISFPTYYRKRKKAVEALSSILWGYTSQECLQILAQFYPSEQETAEQL